MAVTGFLIALLLSGAPAHGADFRSVNHKAALGLANVMGNCAGRVWPGYDWRELTVVLGDAGQPTHFLVNGGKVEEIAASKLPAHLFGSPYEFFVHEGRRGLAVSASAWSQTIGLEEEGRLVPDVIGLAAHEGFHNHGQSTWASRRGSRGTEIPVRWEPRFYRQMAYLNLRAALLKARPEALPRAAYWHSRWASGFAREVLASTDGYEGTANFVEHVTVALSSLGCQASEAELSQELRRRAKAELPESMSDGRPSLDGEGYKMGVHAALLLREMGNQAWYQEMKAGRTPVDVLLGGMVPSAEAAPPELEDAAKKAVALEQASVDLKLGEAIRTIDSGEAIFLSVPTAWYQGSYSSGGFFVDVGRALNFNPLARGIRFNASPGFGLEAQSGAVMVHNESPPCSGWNFVAAKKWLSPDRKELRPAGLFLSGRLRGTVKRGPDGREWFCAD